MLCLGDLVGYGADPGPCIDTVGERAVAMVGGNHEHGAAGLMSLAWFNPVARAAALWTRAQLAPAALSWLGALPLTTVVGDATLVHASPSHPEEWDYLMSAEDGFGVFGAFETRLCFVGHSHRPGGVVAGLERAGARGSLRRVAGGGRAGGRAPLPRQRRAAWGSRAIATRAPPTRCGTWTRAGWRSAASPTITATPRAASSPRGCRASSPIASPVAPDRLGALAPAATRVPLLIAGGILGALAFPATDWWPLAWVWLLPALLSALVAAAAGGVPRRVAPGHRVLRAPAALARSHLPPLQRDPVAADVAAHPASRRLLRPVRGRDRRLGGLGAARGSAPARRWPRWRRSGSRASGFAAGSWTGFRGASRATRSTACYP